MDGLLGQSTGWVETHPNQSWMVWDYLLTHQLRICHVLQGIWQIGHVMNTCCLNQRRATVASVFSGLWSQKFHGKRPAEWLCARLMRSTSSWWSCIWILVKNHMAPWVNRCWLIKWRCPISWGTTKWMLTHLLSSMDWLAWENLNRKPELLFPMKKRGLSCNVSLKPIHWHGSVGQPLLNIFVLVHFLPDWWFHSFFIFHNKYNG